MIVACSLDGLGSGFTGFIVDVRGEVFFRHCIYNIYIHSKPMGEGYCYLPCGERIQFIQ